jgi:hypothetical protein
MTTHASHTPGRKGDSGPTAQAGKDKAQGMAGAALDAVKGAAGAAADTARKAASAVGEKAEHAASAVGDSLKSGAQFLQEQDWSGALDSCANLVRRYPVPALLIGVALGFCMGRVLRS